LITRDLRYPIIQLQRVEKFRRSDILVAIEKHHPSIELRRSKLSLAVSYLQLEAFGLNFCHKMQADEYSKETSFKGKDTTQIGRRYQGDQV
jgi:hypothetical protein